MNLLPLLGGLAGGVGLFLLGMGLMTDGLKLAAGPALERILARSTQTRLRGLATGALVTIAVQSSSAVTVAAIGFVNAGLLTLSQALWVLFGANVGTTMTGWLVALVGMKFSIDIFALPLIGLGMLLRLTGEGTRRAALGSALAGFGVLFLGIDLLKDTFSGAAADFRLPHWEGAIGIVAMVLVGILMTVLMQASAASLVIAFSAAHILFNVLTGIVALLLLPWLLGLLGSVRELLGLDSAPAAKLALFHTAFNILGVLLIWPLADWLTGFLLARFRSAEEDQAKPRYLDKTVLAVPALALDALAREVRHLGKLSLATVRAATAESPLPGHGPMHNRQVVARLNASIADFIVQLTRSSMASDSARRLPELLRLARYYEAAAELAAEAAEAVAEAGGPPAGDAPASQFRDCAQALLDRLDPEAPADVDSREAAYRAAQEAYHALKAHWLEAGASGIIPVTGMDAYLRAASALRRALEQLAKAAQRQEDLR